MSVKMSLKTEGYNGCNYVPKIWLCNYCAISETIQKYGSPQHCAVNSVLKWSTVSKILDGINRIYRMGDNNLHPVNPVNPVHKFSCPYDVKGHIKINGKGRDIL